MKMNFSDMISVLNNNDMSSFFYENEKLNIEFKDGTRMEISEESVSYIDGIVTDIVKSGKKELDLIRKTLFDKEESSFQKIVRSVVDKSEKVEVFEDKIIFTKGGRIVVVTGEKILAYQDGELFAEIANSLDSYIKMRKNVERMQSDV